MPRSKMKKNTPPPPASQNKLNLLRDKMNELKVRYPTNNEWLNQFAFSTQAKSAERRMAFSVAYNAAKQTGSISKICVYVASMISKVSPGLSTSANEALEVTIGYRVSMLPSEASNISVPLMNWSSIVVYFACCILLLFKKIDDSVSYNTLISSCVRELSDIAECNPNAKLHIPFAFWQAREISTVLGSYSKLRSDAIKFLVSNIENEDIAIRGVCKYLCDKLAWSGMHHITLINKLFVKPQSTFLLDRRVKKDVDNLIAAYEAIASHPYPQFYMYLASDLELLMVQPCRFSGLVVVAEHFEERASSIQEMSAGTSVRVRP